MTHEEYCVSRYDGAVMLLPYAIRDRARSLIRTDRKKAEEIRLRCGFPPTVVLPEGELSLGGQSVARKDIDMLLEMATGASVYSSASQLKNGYITVKGGYRIGVCGSMFMTENGIGGFSAFSSAAIRISREMKDVSLGILPGLTRGGSFRSTLIIAPPGAGKTTLLRDVVLKLSEGTERLPALRVSLCDERGEVAAMSEGVPQMAVGRRTDVLDSCPKEAAVMMLLRVMNPQVIALDEITAPEDIIALESARNCGVTLLATVHANSISDLQLRPMYRRIFESEIFDNYVIIRSQRGVRRYEVIRGEDI